MHYLILKILDRDNSFIFGIPWHANLHSIYTSESPLGESIKNMRLGLCCFCIKAPNSAMSYLQRYPEEYKQFKNDIASLHENLEILAHDNIIPFVNFILLNWIAIYKENSAFRRLYDQITDKY